MLITFNEKSWVNEYNWEFSWFYSMSQAKVVNISVSSCPFFHPKIENGPWLMYTVGANHIHMEWRPYNNMVSHDSKILLGMLSDVWSSSEVVNFVWCNARKISCVDLAHFLIELFCSNHCELATTKSREDWPGERLHRGTPLPPSDLERAQCKWMKECYQNGAPINHCSAFEGFLPCKAHIIISI